LLLAPDDLRPAQSYANRPAGGVLAGGGMLTADRYTFFWKYWFPAPRGTSRRSTGRARPPVAGGPGHGLDRRPSQLANKVALVLAWFERHAPE
jgi:hypothetical protein